MIGEVLAVNVSEKRGEKKKTVEEINLRAGHGIEEDAHAGEWHRQVSLLSLSSFEKMRKLGADVIYGDFAENISVAGIDVFKLPLGTKMRVGEALLEVTQIGKTCHDMGCAIKKQVGTCVMPHEGIFTRVLESGRVKTGDTVEVLTGDDFI
ncbi:molybdenum cofactor biosynthesis protein moab [hydrocarbon metagenome]|uniref:Molybdenum cofactor biosynthesis protein moab n=1 Tax=hydrocarbon metagenome TaxID=938273 RepID=A0A0W8E268_9ZZZZ